MPGRVEHAEVGPGHGDLLPVLDRRVDDRGVSLSPQHVVGRMEVERGVQRRGQFRRHRDVVVVAVRADDARTCLPPTASTIGAAVCAASITTTSESSPTIHTLLSTSQVPPSRLKVPEVTTRSMRTLTTRPPIAEPGAQFFVPVQTSCTSRISSVSAHAVPHIATDRARDLAVGEHRKAPDGNYRSPAPCSPRAGPPRAKSDVSMPETIGDTGGQARRRRGL